MKVAANFSVGAVCRAMGGAELDGAIVKQLTVTVLYRRGDIDRIATFKRKGGDRLIVSRAQVDACEAVNAMTPADLYQIGLGPEDGPPAHDNGDLHEFIVACLTGDRYGALALVPRLFDGSNADTAERLLLSDRRSA